MKQPNPYNTSVVKTIKTPLEAVRQGEDNELRIQKALSRNTHRFSNLLSGKEERKLVQSNMLTELTQGFEHRRQSLSMILESRLHSIREACNHVLVTGKTHLRQQRLEYFGQVFRQVEKRMNRLADEFLNDMDARLKNIERFSSKAIQQREQQRLEKSVDDFLTTLDSLMEEFRNIIHENINHHPPEQPQASATVAEEDEEDENDVSDPVMDMFMLGGNARIK